VVEAPAFVIESDVLRADELRHLLGERGDCRARVLDSKSSAWDAVEVVMVRGAPSR
jgi:hypothetical protein